MSNCLPLEAICATENTRIPHYYSPPWPKHSGGCRFTGGPARRKPGTLLWKEMQRANTPPRKSNCNFDFDFTNLTGRTAAENQDTVPHLAPSRWTKAYLLPSLSTFTYRAAQRHHTHEIRLHRIYPRGLPQLHSNGRRDSGLVTANYIASRCTPNRHRHICLAIAVLHISASTSYPCITVETNKMRERRSPRTHRKQVA